jgi:hypothetical protein
MCDGETIVVNLHGALIATDIELCIGMKISIHVYLTNKRAAARVVYIDPRNPLRCGIELDEPRNIWGVSPPARQLGRDLGLGDRALETCSRPNVTELLDLKINCYEFSRFPPSLSQFSNFSQYFSLVFLSCRSHDRGQRSWCVG